MSAALLPIAKLPNPPPNGEVGCELPQREAMLDEPAVLLRMRLPMGPGALLEVSSSCCSGSLSVLRRDSQGTSSLPERVAEVGEARLKGFASLVSRRRVPGLVADDGELTPNALAAPCDNDAFRPLMPAVPAPSLFIVGGLTGELISLVKACGGQRCYHAHRLGRLTSRSSSDIGWVAKGVLSPTSFQHAPGSCGIWFSLLFPHALEPLPFTCPGFHPWLKRRETSAPDRGG